MPDSFVRLWMNVRQSAGWHGPSTLWWRDMPTCFAPRVGDRIEMHPSQEDPQGGGPDTDVKSAYWSFDGIYHVELIERWIDPPPEVRDSAFPVTGRRLRAPWWTERDGDLEAALRASGWRDYLKEPPSA